MQLTLDNAIGREILCDCGKIHTATVKDIIIGAGTLAKLPDLVKKYGSKPYILDDINTHAAAGARVAEILRDFAPVSHTLPWERPEPTETTVGSAIMHFDHACDVVIAVGSGVVGDTAKIVARTAKVPMITVATAPSMDGFASATSSMTRGGLKISLPSVCPVAILADTDIVKNAPAHLLAAGVGDMVAKYLSICEWRISNIVIGEYYCENVAEAVRQALRDVVANAEGLAKRESAAVEAVVRGLILSGVSMTWAGLSRPASGIEHSLSHIWDMRAEEFGTPWDFHGTQCGICTLVGLRLFKFLRGITPDREKALAFAAAYDKDALFAFLRSYMGRGAEAMIAPEARDGKYDPQKHAARLEIILAHWDEICTIIDEELPAIEAVEATLRTVGAPTTAEEIGLGGTLPDTLEATKDIRDKYVLSRLLWDLGVIEEAKKILE